jgi:hypothetical protein
VIQQGQVFKLTAKGADGEPLWAYRYRLEGRSSARPQVGGFASRAEAQKALRRALDRVGPCRGGTTTLDEFVEEYLELHQADPVTSNTTSTVSLASSTYGARTRTVRSRTPRRG